MNEAYLAAACVGLLLLLAFAAVTVNAQWKALKRGQSVIDGLRAERSEILQDVLKLESLLKAARKNDNRDNKGRYAKVSA